MFNEAEKFKLPEPMVALWRACQIIMILRY